MDDFCLQKGIKREFSNARTPQQNGVAERRNRTLIEATRTMLADAKLPVTFWAKVFNIACYVQNRVLVYKSHNKTPYELFNGKFKAKGDEGYFIRYSMSSKAFRVFNKRTKRVKESLHVEFLENKAIEKDAGPNWLFDIDFLTKSMNYVLVVVGTNSTNLSGTKDAASQEVKKYVSSLRYIALPNWVHDALLESFSNESNGVKANVSNMETTITSSPTPTLRIHKDHPKSQIIGPVDTPIQTRNKSKETFLAYASFIGFKVYQMDVKSAFLYGTIDEEVYVMQPPGFQDPEFPARVYKVEKAMYGLHRAPRAWYVLHKEDGIFLSQDKYVGDILKKFGYSDFRSANTPMDKENPWGKDVTGKDVDLHLYRSMIGSLMYLTASRPDIMFAVCTCARHQVTPKECHLHAVKRIFRYLKGHPKLGLWYPKESPFDLVAYSDSDYGGATQDRKSTTRRCQFLDLLTKPFDAVRFQYLVDSVVNMCINFLHGSDSEQRTHEFIHVYLASASVFVWIGNKIMARLQFYDYHNMVAILEKSKHNVDFHRIVDFVEASPLRYALTFKPTVYVSHIRQFWSTARIETTEEGTKILATVDGILRTITESSLRRNLKLKDEEGISSLPDAKLFENLTLMGYNISPNQKFTFQKGPFSHQWKYLIHTIMHCLSPKNEPASLLRDVSQGEAYLTVSSLDTEQDRANIAKTSTLPHESTSRVPFFAADEGSLQLRIQELTDLCTILQKQQSIWCLNDAPIKGRRLNQRDEAAKKRSNDTEEMINVLTFMDAATILSSGVAEVPTGNGSIPIVGPPAAEVSTGSNVIPTASPIFATATVVTPYTRRKGKEKMIESETLKKKKIQEQMYIQMARQLEEEMEREAQRMNEQIARDAEIARIHAEEELQIMIDGLDMSNETVAKYQDNYAKVHKYQTLQRKPRSKKQNKDYYIAIEDFIPIGSKEETKRFKRKRLRLEQVSKKKLKTPEEVLKEVKATEEVPKDKVKEMMQLVLVEEIYVEALQVKHLIIDWTHLDEEDLNQLWALVKESLNIRPASSDKEMELWVELKRLKGLEIVMISYKLQVENYSQMESDMILKIYKIANHPRQEDD
nr:hypothetical protein [Tanacetum cinerariifolium]